MLKRLFKNNWAIGIGTGVLATLLLRGIDKLFINDALWDWAKGIFSTVGNFFNTEYSVKLYFLILLPIFSAVLLFGILYRISLIRKGEVKMFQYPDWTEYTKDVFDGIQYRWDYTFQGMNTDIKNIAAYCNKCSCVLINSRCPNCKNDYSWHIHGTADVRPEGEIHALILHRIENGLYKNTPFFKKQ